MISPRFATMLCFLETDAELEPRARTRSCSSAAVAGSFERISVDGQLSTNDTVVLLCSGRERRAGGALRARMSAFRGARSTRSFASSLC